MDSIIEPLNPVMELNLVYSGMVKNVKDVLTNIVSVKNIILVIVVKSN